MDKCRCLAMPKVVNLIHLPRWTEGLFLPNRYKSIYGGRGSGKTWGVAHALVAIAAREKKRIACTREFQVNLRESAILALKIAIERTNLIHMYEIETYRIKNNLGSEFFFHGFERSREAMRGWEDVDIAWVEEAQRMTQASREVLYPSIRKPGSEMWFSWNPRYRSDPIWIDSCTDKKRVGAYIRKINYNDNPFFPDVLEKERLDCSINEPDRYAHIWEGEPDDEAAVRKVLPYALLMKCVEAHKKGKAHSVKGWLDAGLDVADTGGDKNAFVVRCGGVLFHTETWSETHLGKTFERVHRLITERGIGRLHYDEGGIGAGLRGYFAERKTASYSARPVNFGFAVAGKKTPFTHTSTNEGFFARRNAQLGWALRLRAQNTQRLMQGEDIDPGLCLFIDPAIPRLEAFLTQLSQPEWRENPSGKMEIEKSPDKLPSPDLYDAAALSFAQDSVNGLRTRAMMIAK